MKIFYGTEVVVRNDMIIKTGMLFKRECSSKNNISNITVKSNNRV